VSHEQSYQRRGYEELRAIADAFIAERHPSRGIPIPIEEIIEFQLGLDIVPVPGLLEHFEVDGFLAWDHSEIRVDQFAMQSRYTRYRFTLAYEVGR
jgi:hypothetical protein